MVTEFAADLLHEPTRIQALIFLHAQVLFATGYVYNFPFLQDSGIVTVEDNRCAPRPSACNAAWRHCRIPT